MQCHLMDNVITAQLLQLAVFNVIRMEIVPLAHLCTFSAINHNTVFLLHV